MNEKEFKSWSKYHKVGKVKYTFLITMLDTIGVIIACIIDKGIVSRKLTIILPASNLVWTFGIMFGIITGIASWESSEKAYANYINQNGSNNL